MSTTGAAQSRELRGSQKLLESLSKNGELPTLDEVKKALAFPATLQLEVPNWLVRGVPPAYLQLDATLRVPVSHLSQVIDRFVKLNDSAINLNILINGIPFPEIANIRIRNTPGEV
jgi:hypothetical protein